MEKSPTCNLLFPLLIHKLLGCAGGVVFCTGEAKLSTKGFPNSNKSSKGFLLVPNCTELFANRSIADCCWILAEAPLFKNGLLATLVGEDSLVCVKHNFEEMQNFVLHE